MDNKSRYRALCAKNPDIPIFSRDWWLDITAGEDNWDVSVVLKNNEIIASLPYLKRKKYIFNSLEMPKLTPCLGVWIEYPSNQKYTTKLSYEKETFQALIDNLPDFHFFYQHFHWSVTNWMPFHWQGFIQSTDYTYLIENTQDLEQVFQNFRENIRREIRKAEKSLTVIEEENIDAFCSTQKKTFDRQQMDNPYSPELIRKLDAACKEIGCRKIWVAIDGSGQIHSAIYVVWDSKAVYYLMGGGDPLLRTSGAASLLMWNAIKEASKQRKHFDFVGSMFEPIDRFFRGFGAVQMPYLKISKTNGRLAKFSVLLKEGMKLLR